MKVLVTGANGFIGRAVVEALQRAGHAVVPCARNSTASGLRKLDFLDLDDSELRRLLVDVDVVVNCAGILREINSGDFEQIHFEGPRNLLRACADLPRKRFIQISALGEDEDGAFIATKHEFDRELLSQAAVEAIVIRPSVVLSLRGSYGGTSLLRGLSAMPWVLPVPGEGDQSIQPILLEDLAALVVAAVGSRKQTGLWYAVGPQVLSIRQYLTALRDWLGFRTSMVWKVPNSLVSGAARVGEWFNLGPLGVTINGMLERGNVAPNGAHEKLVEASGYSPASVMDTFAYSASFAQDRWHARLYLLRPLIWLAIVLLWFVSAAAGFLATEAEFFPLLKNLGVPLGLQQPTVYAFSALDLLLGFAFLFRWRVRLTLWLMLLSGLGYTVLIGVLVPSLWLDPLGGLAKNIPLLALILVYLVIEDSR